MCTHGHFVTNRYTHQQFWCKCGKCKACKQEKAAARSSRIRNEYDGKSSIYFCTLTYDRMSAPYFKESDLKYIKKIGYGNLPIYRGHSIKWSVNKQKYIKNYAETLLCEVPVNLENRDSRDFYFKFLKHQYGKIGVCYFPDLQLFQKRFRERLRRQGFTQRLRFFNVVEYGGKSLRPHVHFLLFAPSGYDEVLHTAFVSSWPFGRRVRKKKSFELVKDDPAGYVSSYVNSGNHLCTFLADYFKSKHSSSKLFGHGRKSFAFPEIAKKIESGDLSYNLQRIVKGVPTVFNLSVPKYVVNRFFPLFKGYSRLTSDAVFDCLRTGFKPNTFRAFGRYYDNLNVKKQISYSDEDLHKISIRLRHCYEVVKSFYPANKDGCEFSFTDYAILYEKAWRSYKSTCYRLFVCDDSVDDFYKYDNICMLKPERQLSLFHELGCRNKQFIVDNNEKPHVKNKTLKMTQFFDKYCKQKDTTNYVLSEIYDDF